MKKIVFLALCALFVCTSISAKQLIPFTLSYEDDMPLGNGHPKSPLDPPTVYIEDYTLTFESYHPAYVGGRRLQPGELLRHRLYHRCPRRSDGG